MTEKTYGNCNLWQLGSLSNDDDGVNENSKKAIGLDWQNNNSARVSRFFVHFLSSLHDYLATRKCPISRFVEDLNARQRLSFSFPELRYSLLEFSCRKYCQHLTNYMTWKKRDKVWSREQRDCTFVSDVFVAVTGVVAQAHLPPPPPHQKKSVSRSLIGCHRRLF